MHWTPIQSTANAFHRNGIDIIGMDTYGLIDYGVAAVEGEVTRATWSLLRRIGWRAVAGGGFSPPTEAGKRTEKPACARPFAAR